MCACTASYLHYPSHFSYCNRLYALICFRIRTIPLAFRRVSVCVSLYGFVFALSLPLFVGEELAPPVAPNTAITTTVAKSQPPLAPHHVLASPRKRVRFCCSVKPSQLWWGLLPIRTINEIFRTIPLAFRRASVCVCLVGFASIAIVVVCGRCVLHRLFATTCKHPCLKPLGTHAKASLPCSLLPLHQSLLFTLIFAKEHLSLASL